MTIDKLKAMALASNMQVRLTREERRIRASERNAQETARRVAMFWFQRGIYRG